MDTIFLADSGISSVPADFVKNFLIVCSCLFGAGGFLYGAVSKKRVSVEPSPVIVKAEATYVTKEEFAREQEFTRVEIGKVEASIERRFDAIQQQSRDSIRDLHAHITSTSQKAIDSIEKLSTRLNIYAERIASVEARQKKI